MVSQGMFINRRQKVIRSMSELQFEAIVAFRPENVYYLTGFWGESVAICTEDSCKLIVPRLEARRAEMMAQSHEVITSERGNFMISRVLSEIGRRKVCTDCDEFSTIDIMRQDLSKGLTISSEPFSIARMVKDEDEIKLITKACEIIDKMYERCIRELRPGQSESSLQAILVCEALKMGANLISYKWSTNPLIIASGRNSSYPHAEVTDRVFSKNDVIVVDLTIRYKGYVGDATRTFFVGRPSTRAKNIYQIVINAQQAGIEALTSSQLSGNIDKASRSIIDKAGYGNDFIHSTGHGVGLEVHERPWIRANDEETLHSNMVVTVEPGIYIKDKFGVRIEDTLLIKDIDRGEPVINLNSFTKDLLEIP